MVKLIAWNIAQRGAAWRWLAESDADIALLQEAKEPPADIAARFAIDPVPWLTDTSRGWRAAIAKLSDLVHVGWFDTKPLADAKAGELGVSRPRTLAAARITSPSSEPLIAVSAYGAWEKSRGIRE
jgi:hypothetical protein